MTEVIRSKNKRQKRLNSRMFWLILFIIIDSVGLFLVVRWYGRFTENQRPLTDIDESAFKIFASQNADSKALTQSQRQMLKNSLTNQKVEDFLSMDILNSLKFKNLRSNYEPQEAATTSPSDQEGDDNDLNGVVVGNPQPFRY